MLESPISDEIVTQLRQNVEGEWTRLPSSGLFVPAGAFERDDRYERRLTFGVTRITFKGPFVKGSSWVQAPAYQFAYALESYLLDRFWKLLEARRELDDPQLDSAQEIREFIERSVEAMAAAGANPDLAILAGDVNDDIDMDLYRLIEWQPPVLFHGVDISQMTLMQHKLGGLPLLRYHGTVATPAIYVVHLADYVHVRINPDENQTDDVFLDVAPITAEEARRMIDSDAAWRRSLFSSFKQGQAGEYTREEAVERLQLMVRMRMYGAGTIRERYRPRTLSARVLGNVEA